MKIIINSGIPGVGKTTYTTTQILSPLVVCSADSFLPADPKPQDFGIAHARCFEFYMRCLRECSPETTVVVDNTNLSAWEISPYYLAAQAHNIEPVIRRFVAGDPETCFKRNVHRVPFATFCHMLANYSKRDYLPWWKVEEVMAT